MVNMGNGDRISEIQTPFSMISHPPAALSITAMAEPIGRVLLLLEIPPDDATEVSKIEAVRRKYFSRIDFVQYAHLYLIFSCKNNYSLC